MRGAQSVKITEEKDHSEATYIVEYPEEEADSGSHKGESLEPEIENRLVLAINLSLSLK